MGFFRDRSLSYSVLLHAAFLALWGLYYVQQLSAPKPTRTTTYIEVDPLPLAPTKKNDTQSKQVVQSDAGRITEEATKDAFLGEKTRVVEKEQVATATLDAKAQASQPKAKPKAKSAEKNPALAPGSLAQFGVALPKPGLKPEDEMPQVVEQEGALDNQVKGEYVKGYKPGERTMLNTREYVFFGYFQRIRDRLDRAWEKSLRNQLVKYFYKGRQLASEMDYTTQLLVTLDHDGQVVKVQVIGQSGTRDLDDAAVKAFNQAGPFPNPPQGLVDTRGTIQVRWDFVLRT